MNSFKNYVMKKVILMIIAASFLPLISIKAQNPNLEKFSTYKIGFFTKKMNLTSQEAEKFWPVYNDYQNQKNLIQKDKIMLIRNFNQNESSLSDSQMTEIGDKLIKDLSRSLPGSCISQKDKRNAASCKGNQVLPG